MDTYVFADTTFDDDVITDFIPAVDRLEIDDAFWSGRQTAAHFAGLERISIDQNGGDPTALTRIEMQKRVNRRWGAPSELVHRYI
ncbi:MAG: hypothetical protein QNJ09_03855 [Paracoccaceae bacterium]|nr:hypothetical protein [Paracoccaceae bacterium]